MNKRHQKVIDDLKYMIASKTYHEAANQVFLDAITSITELNARLEKQEEFIK